MCTLSWRLSRTVRVTPKKSSTGSVAVLRDAGSYVCVAASAASEAGRGACVPDTTVVWICASMSMFDEDEVAVERQKPRMVWMGDIVGYEGLDGVSSGVLDSTAGRQ